MRIKSILLGSSRSAALRPILDARYSTRRLSLSTSARRSETRISEAPGKTAFRSYKGRQFAQTQTVSWMMQLPHTENRSQCSHQEEVSWTQKEQRSREWLIFSLRSEQGWQLRNAPRPGLSAGSPSLAAVGWRRRRISGGSCAPWAESFVLGRFERAGAGTGSDSGQGDSEDETASSRSRFFLAASAAVSVLSLHALERRRRPVGGG